MSIQLDGYRVGRTQRLEDLTSDLSTSLGATVDQIWIENPTSSISRMNSLDAAMTETVLTDQIGEPVGPLADMGADFAPRPDFTYKDQQRKSISKQEADKKVSEAGVKLDIGENGIPEAALTILIERKREEIKRQALIDSAPSGFWSGAAQIGTGLAVSLADPIGVASAFIPIVGQARYVKLLAGATSAGGRAGVRAGVGAVEGAVGAAIIEPIVLLAATAEQADYGLYDSYMNLVFGAVLGGGLHTGLGAIGDAVGKSSAATKESLLRAAVGQAMDDKPIDVGYVAQTDVSFQKEWRNNQVARAIEGSEVDVRVKAEFDRVFAELLPSLKAQAKNLEPEASSKAIKELDEGRVPDVFIDQVSRAANENIKGIEASPPKLDAKSPEANPIAAKEAQETIDNKLDETPETLDTLTNDIMTALDDAGIDSVAVRSEIDVINKEADQEAAGMREALMCMIGK